MTVDPVLAAIVDSAVRATCAAGCWVLQPIDASQLAVVAASDAESVGVRVPTEAGIVGLVIASGQPMSATDRASADADSGIERLHGRRPTSTLCVPVADESDVLGVLALADSQNGGFTVDDLEIATLLAGVAAAAVGAPRESTGDAASVSAELARLADIDPARHAAVVTVIEGLLGR